MDKDRRARQQRLEEDQVRRWAAALERQVKSAESRKIRHIAASRRTLADIATDHEAEARATWEVVSRGLDARKPRLFRGRVLLELRCERRGHILARIYPTTTYPVLIPQVANLAHGRNGLKEHRFSGAAHENNKKWRDATRGTILEQSFRDDWIQEFGDDADEIDEYIVTIRGLSVLRPYQRRDEVLTDAGPVVPSHQFLCRCGTSWLATADVLRALDERRSRLTVPAEWSGILPS